MNEPQPDEALINSVAAVVGEPATAWRRVVGGYTPAARWHATFASGATAFVKAGATADTSTWLRREAAFYSSVTAPFLPRFLGYEDAPDAPLIVLEDLSEAHWPPPWEAGHIERVLATLGEVARTTPPPGLRRLTDTAGEMFNGWRVIAADPEPFLSLGLCSAHWLSANLPRLLAAEDAARGMVDGDELLHFDVRSDNLCFTADRTLFVDWNHACIGNVLVDVAAWLPSLEFEGGPPPEEVAPAASEFAALITGYFAAQAGLPNIPDAPFVRRVQREQLSTALPWTIRALRLPNPS